MRDFTWAYEPVPDVDTPLGAMNTGYVTSTVSDAAKWKRGENPVTTSGPGEPGFLLPRPHYMREPGTNLGTVPMAQQRSTMGHIVLGNPNLSRG